MKRAVCGPLLALLGLGLLGCDPGMMVVAVVRSAAPCDAVGRAADAGAVLRDATVVYRCGGQDVPFGKPAAAGRLPCHQAPDPARPTSRHSRSPRPRPVTPKTRPRSYLAGHSDPR